MRAIAFHRFRFALLPSWSVRKFRTLPSSAGRGIGLPVHIYALPRDYLGFETALCNRHAGLSLQGEARVWL